MHFTLALNVAGIKALMLVPSEAVKLSTGVYSELTDQFSADLPSPDMFPQEFKRWKLMSAQLDKPPTTIAASIKICDSDIYPNINTLLTIAATWPVTTCECERSFSGLRRLNTYLRSTQTSERLDSLAMMHVHRDLPVNIGEVIDMFSSQYPRRMALTDILV